MDVKRGRRAGTPGVQIRIPRVGSRPGASRGGGEDRRDGRGPGQVGPDEGNSLKTAAHLRPNWRPRLKTCLSVRTDGYRRIPAGKGADVDGRGTWDMTGLMWAASQGHLDTMTLILDRGPSLELRNEFGGTAMGTTLHFAINSPRAGAEYPAVIDALLKAGVKFEGSRKGTGAADLDAVLRRHGKID